jgi:5-oxoprolinase (ATP-hydrolysing) subunit A
MPGSADPVVDLNADLGEEITDDEALLALVTSANVACGYHAGSPQIMRAVCAVAAARGVSLGAQVSYADRENFGRVELDVPADVLREQVADQVGILSAIAESEGVSLRYVKPHGALYHRVRHDAAQATAVLDGSGMLPVLGLPGSLLTLAAESGREVILEGFPDRAYDGDRLRPRDRPGAVLTEADAIVAQALALAGSVRSLCLHGDTPGAVAHARAVRTALERAGWRLAGL